MPNAVATLRFPFEEVGDQPGVGEWCRASNDIDDSSVRGDDDLPRQGFAFVAHHLGVVTPIDIAVDAFRATLIERGALVGAAATDAAAVGRRAALLVESATAWADHLGPLLDVRATMEILGVTTRQAVYDLVARHRLLGLPRHVGGMAFPVFQFDPTTGRPYGALPGLLAVFAAGDVDAYTVASWLATVQDELDGRCPASLLDDPATARALRLAAKRAAARLGH